MDREITGVCIDIPTIIKQAKELKARKDLTQEDISFIAAAEQQLRNALDEMTRREAYLCSGD